MISVDVHYNDAVIGVLKFKFSFIESNFFFVRKYAIWNWKYIQSANMEYQIKEFRNRKFWKVILDWEERKQHVRSRKKKKTTKNKKKKTLRHTNTGTITNRIYFVSISSFPFTCEWVSVEFDFFFLLFFIKLECDLSAHASYELIIFETCVCVCVMWADIIWSMFAPFWLVNIGHR